jgi:hypothetical protein
MNPFIEKHMEAMRDSIKVLCQAPAPPNPGWIIMQPAPRCLAALHRLLQADYASLQRYYCHPRHAPSLLLTLIIVSIAMADDELRLPGQALLEAIDVLPAPNEDEIATVHSGWEVIAVVAEWLTGPGL